METKKNLKEFLNLLKTTHLNPKSRTKDTAYYHDFIQVYGGGPPRSLFIFPIKNRQLSKINEDFKNIVSSLNKFALYVIYENPNLLTQLHLNNLDLDSIKSRSPDFLFAYSRIDSIFDGSHFRVIEVNARRPQLFEDTDWFSFYLKKHLGNNITQDKTSLNIAKSFQIGYQLNTHKSPETIVLISDFINFLRTKPYGSFLFSALEKTFSKSKIISFSCKEIDHFYAHLTNRNNSVFYRHQKIDLLILEDLCLKNDLIQNAYSHNQLEIFPPPSSAIIGNKLNLSLITNPQIQKKINLNSNEINSLKLILENFSVSNPRQIPPINKNKYVVKIPSVGGGSGVFLGSKMSDNKFYSLINHLLDSKDKIILQKKVKLGTADIFDLDNLVQDKAAITLDPFIINLPEPKSQFTISGYSTRSISQKHLSQNIKFNPETNHPEIKFGGVVGCN